MNVSNYKLDQQDKKAINRVNVLLQDVHKQIIESRLLLTTLNELTKHTDLTRTLQQPGIMRSPNNTEPDQCNKTRYLSSAFTSFVEEVGVKEQAELLSVLQYAEHILIQSPTRERITWMGEPMTSVLVAAAQLVKTNTLKVKEISRIMYFMLTHRKEKLEQEVSDIIDMADDIVHPDDGQNMLELVEDFKYHPYETNTNITKAKSETNVVRHINEFLDDIQSDIKDARYLLRVLGYRNSIISRNRSNDDFIQYILQSDQLPTLLTAFTYLVERIAHKNEYDTKNVFAYTKGMFQEANNKGHKFGGQPVHTNVTNILRRIMTMTHESGVKHRAMILHFMLTHKTQMINNELLDVVKLMESFVTTSHVIHIYRVIEQYKLFPLDTAVTEKQLCKDIINSVFAPFSKADQTYNLSKLIKSINSYYASHSPNFADYVVPDIFVDELS